MFTMEDPSVSAPLHGIFTFLIAAALCAIVLVIATRLASRFGLVDRPDQRKRHKGNVPLVGGLSIFITYTALQLGSSPDLPVILPVMLAGGLLLLVGMADDYKDLSPVLRLLFQGMAASILVVAGGRQIVTLGAIVGQDPIMLTGIMSIVFSIVCVVGVINATNMIDGVDGLAGGMITISLFALLLLVLFAGGPGPLIAELLALIGATGTFLLFNTGLFGERRRIFLGDSGTMALGILLASYYIGFSQGANPHIAPVVAGWIFGLPLMDSVAVMVGRMMNRTSPLKGGRDHLHHRLIDSGLPESTSVLIMLLIHTILVSIGVMGNYLGLSTPSMFWAFVAVVATHYFITQRLIAQIRLRQQSRRISKVIR